MASSIDSEGLQPIRRISPAPQAVVAKCTIWQENTPLFEEPDADNIVFRLTGKIAFDAGHPNGPNLYNEIAAHPTLRYDTYVQNGASDPTNALFGTQTIDVAWFDAGGTANGLAEIAQVTLEGPTSNGARRVQAFVGSSSPTEDAVRNIRSGVIDGSLPCRTCPRCYPAGMPWHPSWDAIRSNEDPLETVEDSQFQRPSRGFGVGLEPIIRWSHGSWSFPSAVPGVQPWAGHAPAAPKVARVETTVSAARSGLG